MAEEDRRPFFHSMGVHVKTPFMSRLSAAAAAAATSSSAADSGDKQQEQQRLHHEKEFTCEMDKAEKEEDGCACIHTSNGQKTKKTGGSVKVAEEQQQQRMHRQNKGVLCGWEVMAVLLCCGMSLLILSVWLVRESRAEAQELRLRVLRLEAVVFGGEAPPFSPLSQPPNHQRALWSLSDASPSSSSLEESRKPGDGLASGRFPTYTHQSPFPHQQSAGYETSTYEEGEDDLEEDDLEEDDLADSVPSHLLALSRHKRAASKRKRRERGGSKRPKVCGRLAKCMKAQETGKKPNKNCKRMLKCIPPQEDKSKHAPFAIKPVHYTSNVSKVIRQKEFDKEAPLHFDGEPDWMREMYRTQQPPIDRQRDGGFNVTQSGVYFIYTSVMFHDVKPRQSQAVVVNGHKQLKCMDSVDYVNRTLPKGDQKKYKTCAISGLLHLKVGDRLEVQNLYSESEIDQVSDGTYMGAILLFPLELSKN